MAYFDCIVGGSGKGNTVTVTCAEEFAGLTITLSKTGKTYTKTCPSTAPYVVTFNGVENGTYTVSATVEGQTYAETVVVQDISCGLNYGFTWKLWVDTARDLDSSDYDTLDEVLEDELAVRELFLEHACVDYMASVEASNADLETIINDDYCAKWINNSDYALDFLGANTVIKALMDTTDKYGYGEWVITDNTTTPPTWGPKGNVPVMTSNTAPYGTASAYQVFDGNASTTASGTDFSYKFVNPICPKSFYCNVSGGTLQASNNGSTWGTPTDDTYYLYLRLHFASSVSPHTIQFYGRQLSVSVPTMTSNTEPYGEAISSGTASGYSNYKAFNKTNSNGDDCWLSTEGQAVGTSLGYKFNKKTVVKVVTIANRNSTTPAAIQGFKLQGRNGSGSWIDIATLENPSSSKSVISVLDVSSNNNAYDDYQIYVTSKYSSSAYVAAGELDFYGLDYSEKEFEVGATKKWLYDHGVELAGITAYKANASNTAEKENNQLYLKGSVTSSIYGFRTASKIDLTAYSLIRTKVGNKGGTASRLYYMGVVNVITDAHSSAVAEGEANIANAPNNESLSISSVNGSYYPVLRETGGNSSSSGSISEWWLE